MQVRQRFQDWPAADAGVKGNLFIMVDVHPAWTYRSLHLTQLYPSFFEVFQYESGRLSRLSQNKLTRAAWTGNAQWVEPHRASLLRSAACRMLPALPARTCQLKQRGEGTKWDECGRFEQLDLELTWANCWVSIYVRSAMARSIMPCIRLHTAGYGWIQPCELQIFDFVCRGAGSPAPRSFCGAFGAGRDGQRGHQDKEHVTTNTLRSSVLFHFPCLLFIFSLCFSPFT